MQIAVSPYHMTTKEPAAMASLLLAERVVTILPTPEVGMTPAAMRDAVTRAPKYARFMESWAWSMPLWRNGLVCSSVDDDDAASDVRAISDRIERDEAFAPLRAFVRAGWFDEPGKFLDVVASDLLKGGPDPAISTTLAAGLDRFAARHRLVVARSEANSVAQRAEARLGRPLFAFGVPLLSEAEAGRVLHIREELAATLSRLRESVAEAVDGLGHGESPSRRLIDCAHDAAAEFTEDFDGRWDEFEQDGRDDDLRLRRCTATIVAMALPSDAVLRSSAIAVKALTPRLGKVRGQVALSEPVTTLPAVFDAADGREVVSLVVKVIGSKHGRRR